MLAMGARTRGRIPAMVCREPHSSSFGGEKPGDRGDNERGTFVADFVQQNRFGSSFSLQREREIRESSCFDDGNADRRFKCRMRFRSQSSGVGFISGGCLPFLRNVKSKRHSRVRWKEGYNLYLQKSHMTLLCISIL